MLNLTRVSGALDVGRLGKALSAPGIDPRTWFSFGIVVGIGLDSEGLFANVTLMPSGSTYPARVSPPYAGPNFGSNIPLEIDDEVAVAIPDGDPHHGCVVLGRFSSASDPLPQDILDHPTDVVLVIKPGQAIRLNVSGDGGKAYIGSTTATDAAVLGTTYREAEDAFFGPLDALASALAGAVAALSTATPTLTGTPAAIAAWVASVTLVADALASFTSAVATFRAGATGYLSQKVNIG